jgi:hypothetical protein
MVIAVVGCVWLGISNRRRDTVIDWGRKTVRAQVGWFSREFTFDEVQELTLRITEPRKSDASADPSGTYTYPARVLLHVGGKRYTLLEVECRRSGVRETQRRLQKVAEELAVSLDVSVA